MESSKQQYLFEIENILNVFTVTAVSWAWSEIVSILRTKGLGNWTRQNPAIPVEISGRGHYDVIKNGPEGAEIDSDWLCECWQVDRLIGDKY